MVNERPTPCILTFKLEADEDRVLLLKE